MTPCVDAKATSSQCPWDSNARDCNNSSGTGDSTQKLNQENESPKEWYEVNTGVYSEVEKFYLRTAVNCDAHRDA